MTPLSGSWTYSARPGETEADFIARPAPQLALKCARAGTAGVDLQTVRRPGNLQLSLWTSEMTRNVSATFNPSTGQVTAPLNAYDPLLDALALSRARIAVGVPGAARWCCRRRAKSRELSRIAASDFARTREQELPNVHIITSLALARIRLIFVSASTQRKEVIRCLMVQQAGRRGCSYRLKLIERPSPSAADHVEGHRCIAAVPFTFESIPGRLAR